MVQSCLFYLLRFLIEQCVEPEGGWAVAQSPILGTTITLK